MAEKATKKLLTIPEAHQILQKIDIAKADQIQKRTLDARGTNSPALICLQLYYYNPTAALTLNLTDALSIQALQYVLNGSIDYPRSFSGASNFTVTASRSQLVLGARARASPTATSVPLVESPTVRPTTKRLSIIEEVANERAIMEAKSTNLSYFFKGEGNFNYVCGKCERLLAKDTWELSVSNIVLKCPACGAYNSIPLATEPSNPKFNRIAIIEGRYSMGSFIELKRGVQLVGVRVGKRKIRSLVKQARKVEKTQDEGKEVVPE